MFTSRHQDPRAILMTGALDNQASILGSSQDCVPTPVLPQPPHIESSGEKQGSFDSEPDGGVFQMYQAGCYVDFRAPATIDQRIVPSPRLTPIGLRLDAAEQNIFVEVSFRWIDPPLVIDGVSYSWEPWQGMVDFATGGQAIYTANASACTVVIFIYPRANSRCWSRATLAHLPGGQTFLGQNSSLTPGRTNWGRMVSDLTSNGQTDPGKIWALLGVNRSQSDVTANDRYDSFSTEQEPYRAALAMFEELRIPAQQVTIYLGYGPKREGAGPLSGLSLGINRNGEWGQVENLEDFVAS